MLIIKITQNPKNIIIYFGFTLKIWQAKISDKTGGVKKSKK